MLKSWAGEQMVSINISSSHIIAYRQGMGEQCALCPRCINSGHVFECRDKETGKEFFAGPECRKKIDERSLKQLPHPGMYKHQEKGNINKKDAAQAFSQSANNNLIDARVAMMEWVLLRQKHLPGLGYSVYALAHLDQYIDRIYADKFSDEDCTAVQKIYTNATKNMPWLSLKQLNIYYSAGLVLKALKTFRPKKYNSNQFLKGLHSVIQEHKPLTEARVETLNTIAREQDIPGFNDKSNRKSVKATLS